MKLFLEKNKQCFFNKINILILFLIIVFIVFLHGTIPFVEASSLNIQAYFSGPAKCIADSGNVFSYRCDRLGYPIGYRDFYGYPIYLAITLLYKYLSVFPIDGIQVVNSICIILGAVTLYSIIKKLLKNTLAGLFAPLLFYVSPFMVNMSAFPGLYQGFLLLPFYITVSLFIYSKINNHFEKTISSFKFAFFIILQVFLLITLIFIDGYSYVMTITFVTVFCLVDTTLLILRKRKVDIKKVLFSGLYIFLLLVPGLIYRFLVFEESVPVFTLDLFRGQGIDILTLLVPTQNWLFAKLLRVGPNTWNAYAFYGDGHNANYNFLGVLTLCVVIATIYLSKKRLLDNKILFTLFIVGAVGFILSLGPSLKINDVREEESMGELTTEGYMMTSEEATLSLPTAVLYKLPVISTMRATYRWQVITRLALVCIICIFIAWLYKKTKIIALLLCVLLIFENLPTSVINSYQTHVAYRKQGESFTSMIVSQLSPHIHDKNVLYLPAENDFLVSLISPFTNSYSYNVFFDKEWVRIRRLQPESVIKIIDLYSKGNLHANEVCSIFKTGLVDTIVFLNFNLRWDSYTWPPTNERIMEYRKRTDDLGLVGFSGLNTIKW